MRLPIALACFAAASAHAQVVETDHLGSQFVADSTAIVPGSPLRVALLFEHDPHWHTYWKNPGDSGLPTKIALELPAGFTAGPIEWPAPQRFVIADIVNYGYGDRVLLPLTITVPATVDAKEITIRAKASWLVCQTECIPGRAEYALTLPVQPKADPDPRWRRPFEWAGERTPQPLRADATMAVDGDQVVVDVRGDALPALDTASVFPATPQLFANGATPAWTRTSGGWRATWPQSEFFAALPDSAELVIVDGERVHAVTARKAGGSPQ